MSLQQFFSYSWHIDDNQTDITVIRVYGLDEHNNSICFIVNNFTPYVYLELPDNIEWNESRAQLVGNKLDDLLGDHKPIKKCLMYKKRLYYAELKNGKRKVFPYLFLSFSSTADIKQVGFKIKKDLQIVGIGRIKCRVHEQDASPILQLTCLADIPTAGWINFVGKKVDDSEKTTTCAHEYIVKWKNLSKLKEPKDTVANPLIMGFDTEVNSSNPSAMPKAEKPGDKVFQISCVLGRHGEKEDTWRKFLLTLGDPDQQITGEDVEIYRYKTESELLEGYTTFIQKYNPNIIVGYNILGFDIPYMIARAKLNMVIYNFDQQGFVKFAHAREKTIKWSSSAYKNQEFQFLDAEGRLYVDLLPLVKRDYKMDNYKLKTISTFFLGAENTKDPLDAQGIFKCYRIGMAGGEKGRKAMGIVGKYCVKDSILVVKLMEKLQTWVGLTEMARVCNVPIFTLYTAGQQIKVYSQVYKMCTYDNYVVEKDGYITKDNEHYTGAHVFDPITGVHDDVVSFDFCSLYPTCIIAYNIDYSTLVKDQSIPDRLCNVVSWNDHIGCCIAEGTHITMSLSSISIESFLNKQNNRLFSWCPENNGIILSKQTKFYDQGYKECVELILEDSTKITCTPDHKFLSSDNIWIKASEFDIESDSIKMSVVYPYSNEESDIKECSGWSLQFIRQTDERMLNGRSLSCLISKSVLFNKGLDTDTSHGFNITMAVSRLLGLLITDGSIDKNGNCVLFAGHLLDVETIQNDIKSICNRNLSSIKKPHGWSIRLPIELSYLLSNIDGVTIGKRTNQTHNLPFFINEECPKPIIREFLGGLFGGDGCTISLNTKSESFGTVGFVKSSDKDNIDSLLSMINDIKLLLLKFDIKSRVYTMRKNNTILTHLSIETCDIENFYSNIGFRYCAHKTQRLCAIVSYIKLRNNVSNQTLTVINRCKELRNNGSTMKEAIQIAHSEMIQTQPIYNQYYSLPNYELVIGRLKATSRWKNVKDSMRKKYFPSVIDYLKKIDAYKFFKNNDNTKAYGVNIDNKSLPTYNLRIISRKNVGIKKVYDIEVENTHNFIANGFVTHNCHDPKVIEKTRLTKIINGIEDEIKELRVKRDKSMSGLRKIEIKDEITKKMENKKPFIKQRADVMKTKPKNPMCVERTYRFLKEPKGILPTILQNLLDARANTRKQMKEYSKKLTTLEGEQKTDIETLLNVLDKRQLAYKVSSNSMYGAMGVVRGYLPFMPGAMATTAMGRKNIEIAAQAIQNKYNGKLIYGDSVVPTTPILCEYTDTHSGNSIICYRTIENLAQDNWEDYHENKEVSNPLIGYKVWTENGFTSINKVIRHKCEKEIIRVNVHTGVVDCTTDHSLLTTSGKKISPLELSVGSTLLTTDLPKNNFNMSNISIDESYVWGMFFAEGSCGKYDCPSGVKSSWAINNQDTIVLEKCKIILNKVEADCVFKILDTLESSAVYKLVPTGKVSKIVQKYRDLFYDNRKYKKVPDSILNSNEQIRQSFLDGYFDGDGCRKDFVNTGCYRFDNKGQIGSAGLYYLVTSLGYKASINTREDKLDIFRITCTKNKQHKSNSIVKKIINIGIIDDYVYDLETENHHFSAGPGRLIVHNTDSNYVMFPHLEGKPASALWDYAEYVAAEVTKLFPKPMELAFEEAIFKRFLILTKKRYMYLSCNRDGVVSNKVGKKGVLLARRDNSQFIRTLYGNIIMKVFNKYDEKMLFYELIVELNKLCASTFPVKDFIVTKSVGAIEDYKIRPLPDDQKKKDERLKKLNCTEKEYTIKCLPAQVQLAEKMRARGLRVDAGSRLEYVITYGSGHTAKQSEKIESSEYYKKHSDVLRLDYMYYLKLLSNPLDQVFRTVYGIDEFVLKQYKYRLKLKKVHEELLNMFTAKIEITEINFIIEEDD